MRLAELAFLILNMMKRREIAHTLAKQKRLPQALIRDQVDELVHKIVKKLQKGQSVALPGLGKLIVKRARSKSR